MVLIDLHHVAELDNAVAAYITDVGNNFKTPLTGWITAVDAHRDRWCLTTATD